jgi:hypothetical protein
VSRPSELATVASERDLNVMGMGHYSGEFLNTWNGLQVEITCCAGCCIAQDWC